MSLLPKGLFIVPSTALNDSFIDSYDPEEPAWQLASYVQDHIYVYMNC